METIYLFDEDNIPGATDTKIEEEIFTEILADGRKKILIQNISKPRLNVFLPKQEPKGAIMIIPGGGFRRLVYNFEGEDIAEWFCSQGYVSFVLIPRLPLITVDNQCMPAPFEDLAHIALIDAQRAMKTIRVNAQRYKIPNHHIGVIGFSAGGHIAGNLANCYANKYTQISDEIEQYSARPDFAILAYPVIGLEPQKEGVENLKCCNKDKEVKIIGSYLGLLDNFEEKVHRNTPPLFIFDTDTDRTTLAENSIHAYLAARRAGVEAELHLFKNGGHGFGLGNHCPLASQWKSLCIKWLESTVKA